MQPVLIGYFPKRIEMPSGSWIPDHVGQLANAGRCDGLAPDKWVNLWLHNELWLYDTEARAWAVGIQTENLRLLRAALEKRWDGQPGSIERAMDQFITQHVPPLRSNSHGESTVPPWNVFAYCIFPVLFIMGQPTPIQLPSLQVDPLPPDYERIGYDPVSYPSLDPAAPPYLAKEFGHSSLSPFCNGRCNKVAVNQFCLLDTEEEGFLRAQEFSAGGGEPEPYVVVEVWSRSSEMPAARPTAERKASETK